MNVRVAAARTIAAVLRDGESLNTLLPRHINQVPDRDRGLYQELCYGTLRWYPKLNCYLGELLEKPFKAKDMDIQALLACALYQLTETRIPAHAAVSEAVAACKALKKVWAKGLVNAVLRRFQREQDDLILGLSKNSAFLSAHPNWLTHIWQQAFPEHLDRLIIANNARPPMTLRVNRLQISRDDYLQQLTNADLEARATIFSADGIQLQRPTDIQNLPGFNKGLVSVQDEAAQLAAEFLQLELDQRVLDACCAPGGKTCHILERLGEKGEVVALDLEPSRLLRVEENLERLQLQAQVIAGDAANPSKWWDEILFDRILLDAPCSATGVIRRHPDIKLLRKPADIVKLAEVQQSLLHSLWPLLKPGGIFLYATCSTLPQENDTVVAQFLAANGDAVVVPIATECGIKTPVGRQLLPQVNGHDGFYYAKLEKSL